MSRFVWLETFEIGVPEIDDDHREMLSLMQRVEAAAEAEDYGASGRLLDALMDHSRGHFAREERYLEGVGYPDVEAHRHYHASLIASAEELLATCKAMQSREDVKACCDRMFGFLIDDVIAGDLSFKSYLDEHSLTHRS